MGIATDIDILAEPRLIEIAELVKKKYDWSVKMDKSVLQQLTPRKQLNMYAKTQTPMLDFIGMQYADQDETSNPFVDAKFTDAQVAAVNAKLGDTQFTISLRMTEPIHWTAEKKCPMAGFYGAEGSYTITGRSKEAIAKTCKSMQSTCCEEGMITKMQMAMNGKLSGYLASIQGMAVFVRENMRMAADLQSIAGPTGKLYTAADHPEASVTAMTKYMTDIKAILKPYAGEWLKFFNEYKFANAKCLERTFNAKSGARCLACSTEPGQKDTVTLKDGDANVVITKADGTKKTYTSEQTQYTISLNQLTSCPKLLTDCRDYLNLISGPITLYMDKVVSIAALYKGGATPKNQFNNLQINNADIEKCMPADVDDVNWDFSKPECAKLCAATLSTVFKADTNPNPENDSKRQQLVDNVQVLGYKTQKRFVSNYNYDWDALINPKKVKKAPSRRLTQKMKHKRTLAADNVLPLTKTFKKKYHSRNLQAVAPVAGVSTIVMPEDNPFVQWTVKLDANKGNKGIGMEAYNTSANLMDLDFSTVMSDAVANEVVPGSGKMVKLCIALFLGALALLMNY